MSSPYIDDVIEAQAGEIQAFGALVQGFQDMAFAVALGWLGDEDAAQDATQEAFLDAYIHLHQLRRPEAFPGWFKRIVVKHCDRMTRRRRIEPDFREDVSADPVDTVAAEQDRNRARALVEALPPNERVIVALQYFADLSGAEIAELLGLPLSTVKKRLRSARARLRLNGDIAIKGDRLSAPSAPCAPDTLSEEVMFFIGIRHRNYALVQQLLSRRPELADATQSWDPQLAQQQLLPYANQATALIVAVELDDLKLLQLLLDAGADPNGLCHCATAESPLWAAALFDRPDHAQKLLAAGADPNLASAAGNYPLHLAAMRGSKAVVSVLLEYGADSRLLDAGPRWPESAEPQPRDAADWALANGHDDLANMIRTPPADGAAVAEQVRTKLSVQNGLIHTGIKALDLFAPIPQGKLTRVFFEANSGVVTLLGEICCRWLDANLGSVVWTGFAHEPIDVHDWQADLAELGLGERIRFYMGALALDEEARLRLFDQALQAAVGMGEQTLLIIVSNPGFEHRVESCYAKVATATNVTSLVVTPWQSDAAQELVKPFAAQVRLDPIRTKRLLLPPIDPCWSNSSLPERQGGAFRCRLVDAARAAIGDYAKQDPEFDCVFNEDGDKRRQPGKEIMAYLRQPFYTTEPFTGSPGEFVDIARLLQEVQKRLAKPGLSDFG